MLRVAIHLILHAAVPALAARLFWPARWRWAWLVMLATMLVDLDHLLADPIFDPGRCSIGHHPLHRAPAIVVYTLMLAVPRARLVATGLLIHMALDGLDCILMRG